MKSAGPQLAPRENIPNWAVLVHVIASALAIALIATAVALERRMSRYTIGAIVLLLIALARCLIPRLNY